jgi:hypothetical protein
MRSKMERSNKNTRTKCNGISITHNTRGRQLGNYHDVEWICGKYEP